MYNICFKDIGIVLLKLFRRQILESMKRLNFIFVFFLASSALLNAQVTVTLGVYEAAGSTNVLLSTSTTINKYSRTISLYTAAEIISAGGYAGIINSLAWHKNGSGEYQFNDAYIKVYLKHVSNSTWPTSPVPVWDTEVVGATEVFSSTTFSIPTGTGWKNLAFTNNFIWNGTSNIAVFVEWYRPSTPTGDIAWGRSTVTSANATRVGSTSLAALVFLVNSNRPLLQLTIAPSGPIIVTGVDVSTQGNVMPLINVNAGTLQMQASVLPSAANQAVTWSILPGTGMASISAAGLVTAQTNGTVWARAVSVQDTNFSDSMQVTISNQIVPITGVMVSTQGGALPQIVTNAGTLQLQVAVLPISANQSVQWSVVNGSGSASISSQGLLTAQTNGTVWAKAVSVQDPTMKDSLQVTISNQLIPITAVQVTTQGSVPATINIKSGTLQLLSTITPANANQSVIWSIIPVTGSASINASGLVTALINGTVWGKASSVQDTGKSDSLLITITNQDVGFEDLSKQIRVSIYPNPVIQGRSLFIQLERQGNQTCIVEAYDVSGRLVHHSVLVGDAHTIETSGLRAGIYYLRVMDEGNNVSMPFIVE
jgi:hypothetical protein